jgi:hypothetical protein
LDPIRFTSTFLIVVAAAFALLWLSQDVPAIISGRTPEDLIETGLFTNPVHVLDLGLFLPACVFAGVALRRRRAVGYYLAPMLLCAMAAIGAGVVSLMVVLALRGQDGSFAIAVGIGALSVVELLVLWRFLRGVLPGTDLRDVLRDGERSTLTA